jgi:methionyl-tRNA formyltransferase
VLLRAAVPIAPADTTGSLHDRLSNLGARLIVEALDRLPDLAAEPQPETGVTYAAKIDKAEARIDWTRPAAEIDRQVRGLSPFPGAWFDWQDARVKVLLSAVADGAGAPGEVLDDALTVACGTGAVRLLRLQRAGRGAQDAAEFLRGTPIAPGTRL